MNKTLGIVAITGALLMCIPGLSIGGGSIVFGQSSSTNGDQDLVILSHRFEDSRFNSEIIGEIMNNGTRSYDKFDVNIFVNFRDANGALISSENGYIDADRLAAGQSSAFNIFLFDSDVADQASTYDLILNDERVVVGQPLNEEFDIAEIDDNGDNGENNDEDQAEEGSDNDDDEDEDNN